MTYHEEPWWRREMRWPWQTPMGVGFLAPWTHQRLWQGMYAPRDFWQVSTPSDIMRRQGEWPTTLPDLPALPAPGEELGGKPEEMTEMEKLALEEQRLRNELLKAQVEQLGRRGKEGLQKTYDVFNRWMKVRRNLGLDTETRAGAIPPSPPLGDDPEAQGAFYKRMMQRDIAAKFEDIEAREKTLGQQGEKERQRKELQKAFEEGRAEALQGLGGPSDFINRWMVTHLPNPYMERRYAYQQWGARGIPPLGIPSGLRELVPGLTSRGVTRPIVHGAGITPQKFLSTPLSKEDIPAPSLQQWGRTPWSTREALRGYASYTGVPFQETLEQMARMAPRTPRGAGRTRWTPARQRTSV